MHYYNQPGDSALASNSLSWQQFPKRTEVTEEDTEFLGEDLYNERRSLLKDFSPDVPMLASDQPRRETLAREALNMQYLGSRGGTSMPWKNDEFDTQFHDADPRGWQQDQNWEMFRKDNDARLRRQPFKNDADYSIPSNGIRIEDMMENIKRVRQDLKVRLRWFDESTDNIAAGRGPLTYNSKSKTTVFQTEDSSATIDTSAIDLENLKNVSTILSNNVHFGGKYFEANTTTDHKVPVAGYGYLFRKNGLEKPESKLRLMNEDRKIKPSVFNQNKKDLMKFLSARTPENRMLTQGGEKFGETDQKYNKIIDQEALPQSKIVIGDIMALMGVTESEIKYINSLDNKNKKQQKQMISCLMEMVTGLEKLPPNARLALRDNLISERLRSMPSPKHRGGVSRAQISIKAKEALRSSNKKSLFSLPNILPSKESFIDPEAKIKELMSSGNFFVSRRRRKNHKHLMETEGSESVHGYEDINKKGKFMPCGKQRKTANSIETDQFVDSSLENLKKHTVVLDKMMRQTGKGLDNTFGSELAFDSTLKSLPKKIRTNKINFSSL